MKQPVELGSVQETLLIPLFSRALETARPNGLLKDARAVEIVEQLDYDFSKWPPSSSWSQACVRTRLFDEIALRFLEEHPEGAIVEIGCGLDTRFERIDNGRATWFELDLPDSIALRRSFFEDGPRSGQTDALLVGSGDHLFRRSAGETGHRADRQEVSGGLAGHRYVYVGADDTGGRKKADATSRDQQLVQVGL